MTEGYVGDGETLPKTPEEALDLISGFVDGSGDSKDDRPDLDEAFNLLTRFIANRKGPLVDDEGLYWGGHAESYEMPAIPGGMGSYTVDASCYGEGNEDPEGRHYGVPHCIFCLQGE